MSGAMLPDALSCLSTPSNVGSIVGLTADHVDCLHDGSANSVSEAGNDSWPTTPTSPAHVGVTTLATADGALEPRPGENTCVSLEVADGGEQDSSFALDIATDSEAANGSDFS